MTQQVVQGLKKLGWVLGAVVSVYGVARFLAAGSLPALLIALAVVIAGPMEDLLKGPGCAPGATQAPGCCSGGPPRL